MNQELLQIIKLYTTSSHKKLDNYLLDKSKSTLIAVLLDLLTIYINDKNSSTIRELITIILAGYKHSGGKIGYNGYKQSISIPGQIIKCEAKPKNYDTHSKAKSPAKLNGYGNFSDYTYQRLKRDRNEKKLNVLVSGFVDGKLIYIFEFPFNHKTFTNQLMKQLKKDFLDAKI